MTERINENLIKEANELINLTDKEIMARSLGKNEKWAENYQMAITIKLRRTLHSLNKDIIKLRNSTNISSWIMGIMTFFILVLTLVLVWRGG